MIADAILVGAAGWIAYTYVGYPLALLAIGRRRGEPPAPADDEWPQITICLVAYNAEGSIAETLSRTIALDYPPARRHILVASDASSDATDAIILSFASKGVELVRVDDRCGKTSCENWAARRIRGDIVVNTDVGVTVERGALKHLVRAFADPTVGVASGHDVSVPPRSVDESASATARESSYVGYEMLVRDLESRAGGIVGASGCLYAVRAEVQRTWLPGGLCRDFASALVAKRHGFRAVSVKEAKCFVPRSTDLSGEFRRKRRTMTRGIATLLRHRALMNFFSHGRFAWMLVSHKLMRWLVPWLAVPVVLALAMLSIDSTAAQIGLVLLGVLGALAVLGSELDGESRPARFCSSLAFFAATNLAAMSAWIAVVRDDNPPVWDPTRRAGAPTFPGRPASRGQSAP